MLRVKELDTKEIVLPMRYKARIEEVRGTYVGGSGGEGAEGPREQAASYEVGQHKMRHFGPRRPSTRATRPPRPLVPTNGAHTLRLPRL